MSIQSPPTPDRLSHWAELTATLLASLGTLWAGARFILRPLVLWMLRRLIDEEYRAELARSAKSAAAVDRLDHGRDDIWRAIGDLRDEMGKTAEHLERLPAMEQDIALIRESSQRTEKAVSDLGKEFRSVLRDLGRVEGAAHRDTVPRSHFGDLKP